MPYQLFLSAPLVIEILQVLARDELVSKIERRRGAYLPAITGLLECFQRARSVELASVPAVSRGPKDDKILATALAARADYLVSEDQDLLVLGTLRRHPDCQRRYVPGHPSAASRLIRRRRPYRYRPVPSQQRARGVMAPGSLFTDD